MLTEKEKTAPFASVGADAEQSSKKIPLLLYQKNMISATLILMIT
ncbi:MAG: hypothetical protein ACI4I9_06105 [Porcipelethomonas sp.]